MKKSIWIFLLAVLLPGAVLGWLALRSAGEQQIIFERRTAELYQKETEDLAAAVRETVEGERRAFSDVVHRLLGKSDAKELARDFTNTLNDAWQRKAIGFAIGPDGQMLSPGAALAKSDAGCQDFIWNNGKFLCSIETAIVYPVPVESAGKSVTYGNQIKKRQQTLNDNAQAPGQVALQQAAQPQQQAEAMPALVVNKGGEKIVIAQKPEAQRFVKEMLPPAAAPAAPNEVAAVQSKLHEDVKLAAVSDSTVGRKLAEVDALEERTVEEKPGDKLARPTDGEQESLAGLRGAPMEKRKAGIDKSQPENSPAPAAPVPAMPKAAAAPPPAPVRAEPAQTVTAGRAMKPTAPAPPAPAAAATLPQLTGVEKKMEEKQDVAFRELAPGDAPKPDATADFALGMRLNKDVKDLAKADDATTNWETREGLSLGGAAAPAGEGKLRFGGGGGREKAAVDSDGFAATGGAKGLERDARQGVDSDALTWSMKANGPDENRAGVVVEPSKDAKFLYSETTRSAGDAGVATLSDGAQDFATLNPAGGVATNGAYFFNRNVEPQQRLSAPVANWSAVVPANADFRALTASADEGMVSRFVQDKLGLIFWIRPPEAPEIVFGCLIEAANLRDLWGTILGSGGDAGEREGKFVLALLDDKARPIITFPGGQATRDWRRPFVASEIGEALPHWEAALDLITPTALADTARSHRWTLSFTIAAAIALIALGGWLVVADVRRQLALAQQKTDFVSNVSHELKTPLTSIRMFAELMHDRPPAAEKQGQYLRIITAEAERLTRLINNVLDFAKLERRQKRFEKKPLDFHALIARVWEGHEMHLRDAGFTTKWESAPGPYPVTGDEDALAQVLVNLLSNAEKYSSEKKDIELVTWLDGGAIHMSVLDRGIGVPEGEERKIFDSFYRAHDSLSSGIQGSGLGLTLAQRLASEHGGAITFERREGGGSRFTLRVPLAE